MVLHVVQAGESLYSIALRYGVPMSQIAIDNGLERPEALVTGQVLVIRFPLITHTVRAGETLLALSRRYGVSLRQLFQNNPLLAGQAEIWPGETIVIAYRQEPGPLISVNAYAYPTINHRLLTSALPYLTFLTPFTYGFTANGELVELADVGLITAARRFSVGALMHLSTLTEEGGFSNELAHAILNDIEGQKTLTNHIITTLRERRYSGLDVDFEYVYPEDAAAYADFLGRLTLRLNALGYPVLAALAPKTSATQRGTLYEGHDYADIGAAVNEVLLMTYEWGYTYGPPMAVAPLPNVRQVVEYALTEIPAEKIWLGVPSYGYDWTLPFVQGESRARSLSSQQAIGLARRYGVEIQYDETAQAPWFSYADESGRSHEVWFEDARSIRAKLALIPEYGLNGVGYWNLMREFPANWAVLSSLYQIRQGED